MSAWEYWSKYWHCKMYIYISLQYLYINDMPSIIKSRDHQFCISFFLFLKKNSNCCVGWQEKKSTKEWDSKSVIKVNIINPSIILILHHYVFIKNPIYKWIYNEICLSIYVCVLSFHKHFLPSELKKTNHCTDYDLFFLFFPNANMKCLYVIFYIDRIVSLCKWYVSCTKWNNND